MPRPETHVPSSDPDRALAVPRAPHRSGDRLTKAAIAGSAMIPTVLGAIAAGAHEAPEAPPAPEVRTESRDAHVIAPIQRIRVVPLTPEHKPVPGGMTAGPDFSFHPRFKALVQSQRGLVVTTGAKASATLYRVAPGDSLYAIAQRTLGNGNRWRELYDANRAKLRSPSLLRIGMTLTLPSQPAAPARGTYHVAQGDSLYVIAARALKNPNRWREIAALNRAQLRGTTTIHPRQVLLLPTV